jgi:membrane protein YqaA with SNARE-associated domain
MLSPERLLEFGPLGLFLVAFFESTVFPIPPDVLLLPLCLVTPRLSWWYAFLTTAASVLGALLGYAIGRKAGRPVVERFVSREMVDKVQVLFGKYGGWAVGVAAFTPIPFKVFTFGAGIFRVPLWIFTLASSVGRSARFFLVGGMVYFMGERARTYLGRNFELATLALTGILLVAAAFYPRIEKHLRQRKVLDRPSIRNMTGAARSVGSRVLALRALGPRILAGISACAVLLLLCVVYLGDLSGPERLALNRSLMPLYIPFSGIAGAEHLWDLVGSAAFSGAVMGGGVLRFFLWERSRRGRPGSGTVRRRPGQSPSGVFGTAARLSLLALLVYLIETALGRYLEAVYGSELALQSRSVFLAPYFLVFGVYLLSKGVARPVQLMSLASTAFAVAGRTASLVLTGKTDAAVATASVLVSTFALALSYTVLAIRRPPDLSP